MRLLDTFDAPITEVYTSFSISASIQSLHSILQREDPCINLAYNSCESLLRKFIKLNAIKAATL